MSFSSHLAVSVQKFASKVKAGLGSFFGRLAEKTEELRFRVQFGFDKLTGGVSPGKQRAVLFGLAGVLAVLLVIIVGMAVSPKNKQKEKETVQARGSATAAQLQPGIIPPEELFLPEEPDFVPGVILEREQRDTWTAGDAAPLWQDPLKTGEEPWRDRLEKSIDEILESVP